MLDIIITCVMLFFVVRGLMRGFVREIASLFGVILGVVLAIRFQPRVTAFIKSWLPSIPLLELVGFAAIFFAVLILCNVIAWALKLLFQKAMLGWADRALGLGLAVVKGVIIIYIGIVLLTFSPAAKTPLLVNSKLAPLIITSYQSMVNLVSPKYFNELKKRFLGIKKETGKIVSESIKDIKDKP